MLCRTIRPERLRKEVVLPLVSLEIERSGPFLKFLDVGAGGRSPKLWACLKFPSYERGSNLSEEYDPVANDLNQAWCCSTVQFSLYGSKTSKRL